MTLSNNVELPPPICCDVPGTFAHDTMSRRVREDILARVFRENNFLQPLTDNLKSLDEELRNGAYTLISPIPDDGGPDVETWNKIILPQAIENRWTWLSAPWLLSEFYLYVLWSYHLNNEILCTLLTPLVTCYDNLSLDIGGSSPPWTIFMIP